MKKILFLVLLIVSCLAGFSQTGNDTLKYTYYKYTYGNRLQRFWADSVLDGPTDTTHSKYGFARKGTVCYVGNGVKWTPQISGTNIYNTDGILTGDRHLSGSLTHNLDFDSINNFRVNPTGHGQSVEFVGGSFSSVMILQQGNQYQSISGTPFVTGVNTMWPDSIVERMANASTNIQAGYKTTTDSTLIFSINATTDSVKFSITHNTARLKGIGSANDSSVYKPVGSDAAGNLKRMDGWPGGGGGGSSGYSVTTAVNTSNYTVPTGRKVYVKLSDLTGQANRNVVLPAATSGDEFVFTNINTPASTFNWTFTSGTVKDFGQNTITTLTNLTVYHLVYDGTNYQIIN